MTVTGPSNRVPSSNPATGADRTWAARYQVNDILRYSRASRETGIGKGEYARVMGIEAEKNLLTVARADGSERTYDPRRQMGVTVYREREKAFSQGDRIQFTAPSLELKIANRELGTLEEIASTGTMKIKLDNGQRKVIDPTQYAHLDHGYAVTSHSSQGQTADRVLIHSEVVRSKIPYGGPCVTSTSKAFFLILWCGEIRYV